MLCKIMILAQITNTELHSHHHAYYTMQNMRDLTNRTISPIVALEMRIMPDYKKMYLKMLAASEEAMRVLIEAQQECEEIYISESEENDADKEKRRTNH